MLHFTSICHGDNIGWHHKSRCRYGSSPMRPIDTSANACARVCTAPILLVLCLSPLFSCHQVKETAKIISFQKSCNSPPSTFLTNPPPSLNSLLVGPWWAESSFSSAAGNWPTKTAEVSTSHKGDVPLRNNSPTATFLYCDAPPTEMSLHWGVFKLRCAITTNVPISSKGDFTSQFSCNLISQILYRWWHLKKISTPHNQLLVSLTKFLKCYS